MYVTLLDLPCLAQPLYLRGFGPHLGGLWLLHSLMESFQCDLLCLVQLLYLGEVGPHLCGHKVQHSEME